MAGRERMTTQKNPPPPMRKVGSLRVSLIYYLGIFYLF